MGFACFVILSIAFENPTEMSIDFILKEIEQKQSNLISVELVIETNHWASHSLLNRPLDFQRTIHVWKDGEKNRTDHNTPIAEAIHKHVRHITCVNGEGKGTIFSFLDHIMGSKRLSASVLKATADELKSGNLLLVDPNKLAFSPGGPLSHSIYPSSASMIRPNKPIKESVRADQWKNVKCHGCNCFSNKRFSAFGCGQACGSVINAIRRVKPRAWSIS